MGIDSSEVRRLAIDLDRAPAEAHRKVELAIRRTAFGIEADGKVLAPVDTGNLRNSITTDAHGLHAEIGPTADYAHFVEDGTSRMAPQPYMRPAFDRRLPALVRAVENAGGDIL